MSSLPVVKRIRLDGVDEDGLLDGRWVMDQVGGGGFEPGRDHSLCTTRDGVLIGGFVVSGLLGRAVSVHMAGRDAHWCSRDLMWMLFDYIFNRLDALKAVALLDSTNALAVSQDLRAGFVLEAVVRDIYDAPHGHLLILTMTRAQCRWLKIKPQAYKLRDTVYAGEA
jgi:hypothetical protein